jgi:hypothetical protein
VGREHVKAVGRRPLRKNISCVSLSSTEEDLALASKIAYAIDEDMAGQSIPLAEQSSASSSQVELFFNCFESSVFVFLDFDLFCLPLARGIFQNVFSGNLMGHQLLTLHVYDCCRLP